MTISERVYRVILKAYPADYRREFGEPMLQLLRDQLRECGPGRWRLVLLWGRILADVLRSVPAAYLESPSSSGGGMMRQRTTLAVLSTLLFIHFGNRVLAYTLFSIQGPFTRFFLAHRPAEYDDRWIYTLAVWSAIDALRVVLAVALFLLIMKKLSIGRLVRGVLVGVPIVAAGRTGFAVLSRVLWLLPVVVHAIVDLLIFGLAVALLLLIMKKLSIPRHARGVLVAVPIVAAGITGMLLDELRASMVAGYLAVSLLLPMSVVVGAWAASAWGHKRDEAGPDETALPIPG